MKPQRLLPLLVFTAAVLPFLPALSNGFVNWDDYTALLQNPAYRGLSPTHLRWMFTTFLLGHYQPLAWLTYGLDYLLWGMHPFGYHLTSIVIHGLNAVLLYKVGLAILEKEADWGIALGALLFGLHPLRVESVVWATERRDVLSAFFYLACVLAYLRWARQGERRWGLACLALGGGALLSKVTTLSLPLTLLILDYYPLRRRALLEKIPLALLCLAVIGVGFLAQAQSGALVPMAEVGVFARLHRALFGLGFYPWKTAWPWRLSPWYDQAYLLGHPAIVFLGAGAVAAAGWCLKRGQRAWAAAWGFYLASLFPMLGLVQSGRQVVADRYSYLPLMGFALLAGAGLSRRLGAKPRTWATCAALLLCALAARTSAQSQIWRDSATLWTYAAQLNPASPDLTLNIGFAFSEEGRFDEALAVFRHTSWATAVTRNNHATRLAEAGKLDEAIAELKLALPDAPRPGRIHDNLGILYYSLGRYEEAAAHFAAAARLDPADEQARHGLEAVKPKERARR